MCGAAPGRWAGGLILADFDGIVVVPRAAEAEVLRQAAEKTDFADWADCQPQTRSI
jgi:regulator of RNase E activity RraA